MESDCCLGEQQQTKYRGSARINASFSACQCNDGEVDEETYKAGHTIKMYDINAKSSDDRCMYTLREHDATINALTFSPDGDKFASVSDDHTMIIWDTLVCDTRLPSSFGANLVFFIRPDWKSPSTLRDGYTAGTLLRFSPLRIYDADTLPCPFRTTSAGGTMASR